MERRIGDAERLERVIERVARDLPEIGVPALQRAQPGVLKLLVAPQRRQRGEIVTERVAALCRRGGVVEQRAVSVEDAGANAGTYGGRPDIARPGLSMFHRIPFLRRR